MTRRVWIAYLALIVLIVVIGYTRGVSTALLLTAVSSIYALVALGLNIQFGYGGLFNLAIMGLLMIGGMTVSSISMPINWAFWNSDGPMMLGRAILAAIAGVLAATVGPGWALGIDAATFLASAGLLAAFTIWMGWISSRRLRVRCGCFGGDGGEVGPRTLLRNAVLLVVAAVGWVLAERVASPLPGPSWEAVATAVALALSIALVQALRMVWPNLVVTYEHLQGGGAGIAAADLE